MKKIFVMVLSVILVLGMTACSDAGNAGSDGHAEQEETFVSETGQSEKETRPETDPQNEITDTENALNNSSENSERAATVEVLTEIRIQIEDRSYDAFLYDNEAGRYMAQQLPYTIRLNKGEIDYCGTCALDFENHGFAGQEGHLKGELLYYNGWFVIFLNEKLPLGESGPRIPFGKLSNPADADDMLQNAASSADVTITDANDTSATTEESEMKMTIGDTPVTVLWEENESVDALRKLVSEKPLSIQMSMYGGFEQVGSIGQSLPRNDVQTTTNAGDIVLYSGNQMVVFYGSNSWGYTRLGHITDKSAAELKELLGNGNVAITIE